MPLLLVDRKFLPWTGVFAMLMAIAVCATRGEAALVYANVPGIAGQDSTPGYPDAMLASSVTIAPDGFSLVKKLDAASPQIVSAVTAGTPLGTASLLFYNAPPAAAPDAALEFPNTLASAYQVLGGGNPPTEQDSFSSTAPAAIYFELPGITGESFTPGHPGVMQVQSATLAGNTLSFVKAVDLASPQILLAIASGTHFSVGRLLFYDALAPTGAPSATIEFHEMLGSATQMFGNGNPPLEQDTFQFVSLSQPVPEPAAIATIVSGAAALIAAQRRRIHQSLRRFLTIARGPW